MQKQPLPTRPTDRVTTLPEPAMDSVSRQPPTPKPSRRTWAPARIRALMRQPVPRPAVLALMAVGIVGLIEGIMYLTKSDEEFVNTYIINKRPWF